MISDDFPKINHDSRANRRTGFGRDEICTDHAINLGFRPGLRRILVPRASPGATLRRWNNFNAKTYLHGVSKAFERDQLGWIKLFLGGV